MFLSEALGKCARFSASGTKKWIVSSEIAFSHYMIFLKFKISSEKYHESWVDIRTLFCLLKNLWRCMDASNSEKNPKLQQHTTNRCQCMNTVFISILELFPFLNQFSLFFYNKEWGCLIYSLRQASADFSKIRLTDLKWRCFAWLALLRNFCVWMMRKNTALCSYAFLLFMNKQHDDNRLIKADMDEGAIHVGVNISSNV